MMKLTVHQFPASLTRGENNVSLGRGFDSWVLNRFRPLTRGLSSFYSHGNLNG